MQNLVSSVFQSQNIDEIPALRFSFNFTFETGIRAGLDWDLV